MSGLHQGRSDVSLIRFGERNVATANALQKTQLERSQKIQQILLILRPQPEGPSHDSVRLRARAPVFSDRLNQIPGTTVMKEEQSLSQAPEGSAPKFSPFRLSLAYSIGETRTHVMDRKVRVQVDVLVVERRNGRVPRA